MSILDSGQAAVRWHDALDSTNAEARRLAEAGQAGPLWIAARRQTAGRGRLGRIWQGAAGSLAATLLISVELEPAEAAQMSFLAALAVHDLLAGHAPRAEIRFKWPNDVQIAGRKAAGILIESGRRARGALWLAVGIGVNLAAAPEGVEPPPAALADHLPPRASPPSPETALAELDASLARWIGVWRGAGGFLAVREAWLDHAAGLGAACTARMGSAALTGVAEGLDADGALLLRLETGARERITAGDVFFGDIA